jgi:hypothetical protein
VAGVHEQQEKEGCSQTQLQTLFKKGFHDELLSIYHAATTGRRFIRTTAPRPVRHSANLPLLRKQKLIPIGRHWQR